MSHPDNRSLATAFVARSGGIVESDVFHHRCWDGIEDVALSPYQP